MTGKGCALCFLAVVWSCGVISCWTAFSLYLNYQDYIPWIDIRDEPKMSYDTSPSTQLVLNWRKQPFVNITVAYSAQSCPDEFPDEVIYY